jgi:hypothetical protein
MKVRRKNYACAYSFLVLFIEFESNFAEDACTLL